VELIAFAAMLVGWVLLLPFAAFRLWKDAPSRHYPGVIIPVWRWRIIDIVWGNDEDGVIGAEFYRKRFPDERVCAYMWSAYRNSSNNLRWVFAWKGGPFYRWESKGKKWYFQAGFRRDFGWPVLSAGRMWT
jgi:hypothetical protein